MGPSPSMSSQQTLSRMSRLRSRTKKVSLQISKDSSSPESNWKMAELFLITTSKRSPLSISSSDLEVVCRSLSRLSPVRPSPLMSSQQTPLRTSKPRSRIRKEFLQISKDSSSPESKLKMEELSPTTTSKKNHPFILSSDSEVVCKFSSRLLPVRPSPLMSSQQIPSRMLKQRSKTRKVPLQISKDLSSLESNLKMEELSPTITSKRNPHFISFLDSEVVCKSSSRLSLVRPLPLTLSQQTPSRMLKPRSKIRKESLQISKDSSSLESNSRMVEHFLTITSRRSPLSIWSSDLEEASDYEAFSFV